jgi:hypothetical protein
VGRGGSSRGLFEAQQEAHPLQADEETLERGRKIAELPTADEDGLQEQNATKSDWISRAGRQDRSFKSGYRPRTSDARASKPIPTPPKPV